MTPTSTVVLEGVEMPAPADPEAMLAFVYGPGWRVPDPSFKFADPAGGVRRLDGWLRGYRDELPAWNGFFRGTARPRRAPQALRFARWVARRVLLGDTVVELGSGTGRDAAYFARRGHRVRAYDISPDARRATQRRLRRSDDEAAVHRLMLDELRTVVVTGAEIGLLDGRRHVYARGLVGCVERRGAAATCGGWRGWPCTATAAACSWSSRRPGPTCPTRSSPPALNRRVDADAVVAELEAYGAHVDVRVDGRATDLFDQPDPWTCRLQVTFPSTGANRHV